MRPSEVVRTVVGSIVVYVIVAACSGGSNAPSGQSETAGTTSESPVQGGAAANPTDGRTSTELTAPAATHAGTRGTTRTTDGTTSLRGGAAGANGAIAQAGRAKNSGGVEGASGVTVTGGTRASATTAVASAGSTGILTPVPEAKADPVSGTRLKARYREGADGSKEFLYSQWWDSERGEDCVFLATADDNTRCVPSSASAIVLGSYFSDSACALELAMATTTCNAAPPKYVMKADSACGGYRFYKRATNPHAGAVYTGSGTACTEMSTSLREALASYQFYALGDEVPLTSFVASTLKTAN